MFCNILPLLPQAHDNNKLTMHSIFKKHKHINAHVDLYFRLRYKNKLMSPVRKWFIKKVIELEIRTDKDYLDLPFYKGT